MKSVNKPADDGLTVIDNRDDIPSFASEPEEAEYWGSRTLSDRLLASFKARPPWMDRLQRTASTTWIRVDDETAKRISQLAVRRNCPPERLVQEFISDRLAEEETIDARSSPAD